MRRLRCDMHEDCEAPVTHVDDKGWLYCVAHGEERRQARRCRRMTHGEVERLESGMTISYDRRV